jgi:hypothetical protein
MALSARTIPKQGPGLSYSFKFMSGGLRPLRKDDAGNYTGPLPSEERITSTVLLNLPWELNPESQGKNSAMTVLYAPSLLLAGKGGVI